MDKRKLISFGNSSYVVSIPKTWIEKNRLEKGSSVYVNEKEDNLIISVGDQEQKRKKKEAIIDASNKSKEYLKTEIISNYLNNYDIIEVKNIKDGEIKNVKEIIQNLAGMEIMEETSTKIIAKDLININEASIKTLIRRIDIIIRSMFDDVIVAIKEKENFECVFLNVYQRDEDVNRLVFLVRKMMTAALEDQNVTKIFNTNPLELVSDWSIVERLEKIGDQIKRIARCLKHGKLSKNHREELANLFLRMHTRYLDVMRGYYSKDCELAYKLETTNNIQVDELTDLLHKIVAETHDLHVVILIELLKSMSICIRNIARSIIMNSVNVEE